MDVETSQNSSLTVTDAVQGQSEESFSIEFWFGIEQSLTLSDVLHITSSSMSVTITVYQFVLAATIDG